MGFWPAESGFVNLLEELFFDFAGSVRAFAPVVGELSDPVRTAGFTGGRTGAFPPLALDATDLPLSGRALALDLDARGCLSLVMGGPAERVPYRRRCSSATLRATY